jgi:Flp pilus assembly protein protease CpaA
MNTGVFLCAKRISNTLLQALSIMLAIFACIISQEVSSVFISIIPIFYAFKLSKPQELINDED